MLQENHLSVNGSLSIYRNKYDHGIASSSRIGRSRESTGVSDTFTLVDQQWSHEYHP